MSKYSHTLNLDTDNSAALIVKQVVPNTTVLEFGSANGYMTQYLKETLGCTFHIVEIDREAGLEASKYADDALLGWHDGDIEMYQWVNFDPVDHIIFADVLEHLRDPWKVLGRAANLIKDGGSILISVPNVGHNSIIIDLLNGKFDYRELGLLDNTHLRFFTRKSLNEMVEKAGLFVSKEMNTFCSVEHTEFQNFLDDVPECVSDFLNTREDGILYQFVWELKRSV